MEADARMALYAPLSLLALPFAWLTICGIGYMAIYWALGIESLWELVAISGSSLLTLGFDPPPGAAPLIISFSEAALGLTLVALLISYLPAMYGALADSATSAGISVRSAL